VSHILDMVHLYSERFSSRAIEDITVIRMLPVFSASTLIPSSIICKSITFLSHVEASKKTFKNISRLTSPYVSGYEKRVSSVHESDACTRNPLKYKAC